MSFAHERNSGRQGWIACDPPEHTGYDKNGNRTMTGYTTGSDNELTAANGNTYAYDAEGNMTGETDSGGNVWTFAYDYRDRMTGFAEKSSGGTIIAQGTYVYDALDRRIETIESVSGGAATVTWMVYNGFSDTPFAEYSSGGTLEYRYLSGPSYIAGVDALLARTSSGGTTGFYLTDQLGSVTDIVNSSGTVLDHIAYDPFGNILSETSPSNGDQFKFEGMAWDLSLVFYNDFHRYYQPLRGRFTAQDPLGMLGGNSNLFEFGSDSPNDYTDPTGCQVPNLGLGAGTLIRRQAEEAKLTQLGGMINDMIYAGDFLWKKYGGNVPDTVTPTGAIVKFPRDWLTYRRALIYTRDNYVLHKRRHVRIQVQPGSSHNIHFVLPMPIIIGQDEFYGSPDIAIGTLVHEALHDPDMYGPGHVEIAPLVPTETYAPNAHEQFVDFLNGCTTSITNVNYWNYILARNKPK